MRAPLRSPLPTLAASLGLLLGARAEIIGMDTFDVPDGPAHARVSGAFWDFHRHRGHQGEPAPWCGLSGDPEFRGGRLLTPAPCKALRTFAHTPLEGRRPGYWHNKPGQVYDGILENKGSLIVRARVEATAAGTGVGVHFYDWNSERVYVGILRGEDSPRQWQTWWWICFAGQLVFIPFAFVLKGRWSPRKAREDEAEHARLVEGELAKLQA